MQKYARLGPEYANSLLAMNTPKRPCLPLFKSLAEAIAMSKKQQDTFYVDTLYIQRWLARANKEAVAEYAEKKDPRDRALQTGSAWRLFRESFGDLSDPPFVCLFKSMATARRLYP